MRTILMLASAIALLPLAAAGTLEDPEITDPAGDAGPNEQAAPAGYEWADLRTIWIDNIDADSFRVNIQVTQAAGPPEDGDLGLHLRIDGTDWLVGYAVIHFPFPPFVYEGPYVCESDAEGNGISSTCGDGATGGLEDDAWRLTVTRASVDARGARLLEPMRGHAMHWLDDGTVVMLDSTEAGRTVELAAPAPEEQTVDETERLNPEPEDDASPAEPADAEAPSVGTLAVVAPLAALMYARRRT